MIVVALKVVIHSALLAIESCKAFFFPVPFSLSNSVKMSQFFVLQL